MVAELCFIREDSNPAVCGVHNVMIVSEMVPIDVNNARRLGKVLCQLCPVSRVVVDDAPKKRNLEFDSASPLAKDRGTQERPAKIAQPPE
jgi:hypothetical protein